MSSVIRLAMPPSVPSSGPAVTETPLIEAAPSAKAALPDPDTAAREGRGVTIAVPACTTALLRAAIDWCWEQDDAFRFVSTGLPSLLGLEGVPAEFIGKAPWEIAGIDILGGTMDAFRDAHRKQLPYRDVLIRRRLGLGRTRVILASAAPVFDERGILTGYRGTGRDVTRIVREREVAERAREEAEHRLQVKSRFFASMSHEIRTPIAGVLGMLDLLHHTTLDPEQERLVQIAAGAGESLLVIVNDLLDLSRMEAGHVDLRPSPFEIRRLAHEVLALLAPKMQARPGVALRADVATDVPDVLEADPHRLRQVLINLLANAIRFTDAGAITLRVTRTGETRAAGARLVKLAIAVEDTGAGMSADAVSRLFRPFAQVGGTDAQRAGGTGLGLMIVKEIVTAMGGTIEVTSVEGRGSIFTAHLALPIAHAAMPVRARPPTPEASAVQTGGLVLLVEDNPVNRAVARSMLTRLGVACEIAGDGQAAVTAYRTGRYDAILMDCQMPVMDGYEATRAIRAIEKARAAGRFAPRTPIIALTANAQYADRDAALAAGMDDWLTKPFKAEQLGELLQRWVQARRTTA